MMFVLAEITITEVPQNMWAFIWTIIVALSGALAYTAKRLFDEGTKNREIIANNTAALQALLQTVEKGLEQLEEAIKDRNRVTEAIVKLEHVISNLSEQMLRTQ